MPDDESLADTPTSQITAGPDISIVDTILDLDEALSGDVRRAERTARFSIEPWRQATLDRLEAELADLVDDHGNPLESVRDSALATEGRDFTVVMSEYRAEHDAFVASMRSVTVSQMPPSQWEAFKTKWRKQIDSEQMSAEMRRELVVSCAIRPTISPEQYAQLTDRYGEVAMVAIGRAAWAACDHTGVDVPKSQVYSAVRRQLERSRS